MGVVAWASGVAMHRFIDDEDRIQQTLLPNSTEDYVEEEKLVRVIDVFIDELNCHGLGQKRSGCPPSQDRTAAFAVGAVNGFLPTAREWVQRADARLFVSSACERGPAFRRMKQVGHVRDRIWLVRDSGRVNPGFKPFRLFVLANVCR
jgi:hypothetical protein